MIVLRICRIINSCVVAASVAVASAGGEMLAPPQTLAPPANGTGQVGVEGEGAVPAIAPAPEGLYEEYFAHSAYVRRSFVPGYTPHATSLFENPRTYPLALSVMATPYYQYAGIKGWFFASPRGIQSSVPENSHALAYFRGELGITSQLKHGYPQGLRVIEPVIIPFGSSMKKGGYLISAPGVAVTEETVEETPWFPEKGEKGQVQEVVEVLAVPTPAPTPTPIPMFPPPPTPLPRPISVK